MLVSILYALGLRPAGDKKPWVFSLALFRVDGQYVAAFATALLLINLHKASECVGLSFYFSWTHRSVSLLGVSN